MKRTVLLGSCCAVVLAASACTDAPAGPDPEVQVVDGASSAVALDRGALALPPGVRISDQYIGDIVGRAIDGDDYVCPASTAVVDWFLTEAYDFIGREPAVFELVYLDRAADLAVLYDALVFARDDTPQYFGYQGEYTRLMQKTHKDAKRFWDIEASDVQLIGMHGSMLLDVDRVAAAYEFLGLPPALAQAWAEEVAEAVAESEVLNGGNHPLFSFNAFAISAPGLTPDKIVMGDGILAGYEALGFGDVAAQAIYAHEFAHHIQFENGYFDDPFDTVAEETRYTELMADAMAAYYLTHKRGATMNAKRVAQFLEVFYQIGDCGFSSPGHHGTPAQRMRAAQFGFDLADEAQKQGHIMSSEEFYQLFVAAYPELIAPDAI